jgi:GNAT superfamily N-acetyltransferase
MVFSRVRVRRPDPAPVEINEDDWLSERFGHPVFTLTGLESGVDLDSLRRHTNGQAVASYQAKVPSGDVGLAHELCSAGFRVVCTAVTLRRPAAAPPPEPASGEPPVRPLDPRLDSGLPERVAGAFRTTRFHLDPVIPDAVAHRIKRDWADAYVAGTRGESALTVELDGRSAGLLGVVAQEQTRTIDLLAVSPDAQGRGAGRALIRRFCEDSRDCSDALEVGTQAANEPAIRRYERLGFETARTAYDLHLHLGSPWTRF